MPKPDIMTHREYSTKAQTRQGKLLEPDSPDEERAYKNAVEVLSMIRDGTLKASDLKAQDRRPVVAYLRLEGYSNEEMSRLFEVSSSIIKKDLEFLTKDKTQIIKKLNLLEIAGNLYQVAQHLSRKARREGSYAASWKIEKELIDSLQSMGFVYRAPKTLGIASIHANLTEGHSTLTDQIGTEKDSVVDALGSILSSLKGRKIRLPNEQSQDRSNELIEISGS